MLTEKDANAYVKKKKLPELPKPLGTDPNSMFTPCVADETSLKSISCIDSTNFS